MGDPRLGDGFGKQRMTSDTAMDRWTLFFVFMYLFSIFRESHDRDIVISYQVYCRNVTNLSSIAIDGHSAGNCSANQPVQSRCELATIRVAAAFCNM